MERSLSPAGPLGLAGTTLGAWAVSPGAVEPFINGRASASGRYPSQAEEDAAEHRLEQAVNGQVWASGRYSTLAIEDPVFAGAEGWSRLSTAKSRASDSTRGRR